MNLEPKTFNDHASELEELRARVHELEKRPRPIPPKPRKALPWPRAAVQMTWIVTIGLIVFALLLIVAAALN